jgi:glycerophosphoryl diester phosphodiesterase
VPITFLKSLACLRISSLLVLTLMNFNALSIDSQGHRGARGLLPENTLPAFARALAIGVTTLELDVVLTADDQVVVTHNPRLEPEITRDPEGNWLTDSGPLIRSLTLAELKRYDVGGINPGTRYAKRFPHQETRTGTRIPTLSEVIKLVKETGDDTVKLNIETKLFPDAALPTSTPAHFAGLLVDVIRDQNFIDRSIVQSFNWSVLKEVQRLEPELATSFLTAEQKWMDNIKRKEPGPSPWTAGYDIDDFGGNIPSLIKQAGGDVWSSYFKEITRDSVSQAHDLGLRVSVWTVNEEVDMENLIELGVDGIITDYPDRMINVMQRLGLPLPQALPVLVD